MVMDKKRARRVEKEEEERERGSEFAKLPQDCILHVFSFATPRDSCRSAVVSKAFYSCTGADALWERFLPSDYAEILSRAVNPVSSSSKKELYFGLCKPILIDGGKLSFHLERSTGSKCYMVSSRNMWMTWGHVLRHWRWISHSDSRFGEVAELVSVCWFDIGGSINSGLLSKKTWYTVYIVFELASDVYGLNAAPQKVSISLGTYSSDRFITLQQDDDDDDDKEEEEEKGKKKLRDDGWMEIELGDFYNDEGDQGERNIAGKITDKMVSKTFSFDSENDNMLVDIEDRLPRIQAIIHAAEGKPIKSRVLTNWLGEFEHDSYDKDYNYAAQCSKSLQQSKKSADQSTVETRSENCKSSAKS
ncbi:F-box protein [Musa troglodytarum]|uniref:F-box protein n=1 Tax=Musa troglodytarum TaxID=320322 RepID=A0A9E7HNX2_9LILI|nr:F-box protein [Musa troglodytarum]